MWFIYGVSFWSIANEDTNRDFGVVFARDFGDACDKLKGDYTEIEHIELKCFFSESDCGTLNQIEIIEIQNELQKMMDNWS